MPEFFADVRYYAFSYNQLVVVRDSIVTNVPEHVMVVSPAAVPQTRILKNKRALLVTRTARPPLSCSSHYQFHPVIDWVVSSYAASAQ